MRNIAPYIRNILLYKSSFRSVPAKNKPYSRKNLVSENHIRGRQCTTYILFCTQEIDGSSLLLLQRQDVVAGLGLKMGPALKVFEQVRKLQTRRHLPATAAAPTLSRSS